MADGTSLISLGELTKPATVLIEKIADAVGGLFAPSQIVRLAKAEAAAERIRAESRADIEDRAVERLLREETRKQANIENITRLALPDVQESADPAAIDHDWIVNFFDKSRLTADEDLQLLWSRILSGEANAPGRFGKRTVNLVATITRSEAEQFTALCALCWKLGDEFNDIIPVVLDESNIIYKKHGIAFDTILHLESVGLVRYQPAGFSQSESERQPTFSYFGRQVRLTLPVPSAGDYELGIGRVMFSRVGLELAPIAGAEPSDSFFEYVLGIWRTRKYYPSVL